MWFISLIRNADVRLFCSALLSCFLTPDTCLRVKIKYGLLLADCLRAAVKGHKLANSYEG